VIVAMTSGRVWAQSLAKVEEPAAFMEALDTCRFESRLQSHGYRESIHFTSQYIRASPCKAFRGRRLTVIAPPWRFCRPGKGSSDVSDSRSLGMKLIRGWRHGDCCIRGIPAQQNGVVNGEWTSGCLTICHVACCLSHMPDDGFSRVSKKRRRSFAKRLEEGMHRLKMNLVCCTTKEGRWSELPESERVVR
jgi:hypothetical protein